MNKHTSPTPAEIDPLLRALGPAPRLFASASDWAALCERLKTDPVLAATYRKTRERAEALLAGPLLEHKEFVAELPGFPRKFARRLESARLLQGRILDLAAAARVENDPRYAARAREEMLATAALPDWGSAHFLDVAEYALAMAVGSDWLHDFLTPADRDLFGESLIQRAIQPTFDSSHPSLGWIEGTNNWTQVCHAGLTAAALAISDRDPDLAARTISRAIKNQSGPNAGYAPDGAYPEGPMYWAYGTSFEVILISLLEHSFGTDFGLTGAPGFLASAQYLTYVTAPGGTYFNYADARSFVPPRPILHWFAAKCGQPEIAAPELLRLEGRAIPTEGELQAVYERHDALALWWRKPQTSSDRAPLPTCWMGRGSNPVAVFRSAWDDPRAAYVAIKGGSPALPHGHMDVGSFIFESAGVRWAIDPGMQDYQSLEGLGVNIWDSKQEGVRWKVFRLGSESHNILRFNGAPQLVKEAAAFMDFQPGAPAPGAVLDLTPLYHDHATSVRRSVTLLDDQRVTFQDEWTAGSEPVEVAWQWLTTAKVRVEDRAVILEQDGESLRLRVLSPGAVTIEDRDASELLQPYDEPNPGLRRIRIISQTPARASGGLTILAEPLLPAP